MNEWLYFPYWNNTAFIFGCHNLQFGTKTKETLGGFYKVVSLLKTVTLSKFSHLVIGDNVKLKDLKRPTEGFYGNDKVEKNPGFLIYS